MREALGRTSRDKGSADRTERDEGIAGQNSKRQGERWTEQQETWGALDRTAILTIYWSTGPADDQEPTTTPPSYILLLNKVQ